MTASSSNLRIFKGEEEENLSSSRRIPISTQNGTDPITLELMKLAQYPDKNWHYQSSALRILRWLQALIPATQSAHFETADEIQEKLLRLEEHIEYFSWLSDINTKNTNIYVYIQKELINSWRRIRNTILLSTLETSHSIPPAPVDNTRLLRIYTEISHHPV